MTTAWHKFRNDFIAMSDEEIKAETDAMTAQVEEAEEWLEAVAAWTAAGKPRNPEEA